MTRPDSARSADGRTRTDLARRAARDALRLRQELKIPFNEPVCVYDVIERLGIELRFVDYSSLEGMYVRSTGNRRPLILVCALRPAGRQVSTAAHELGHHQYGHGTRIDQYVQGGSAGLNSATDGTEEISASAFGAFFLMPKAVVERGFRERGVLPTAASDRDVYTIAGWLGVGYTTLVHHMRSSLDLLDTAHSDGLLASQPKRIREEILGFTAEGDVLVADGSWTGRPLDLQVGDYAVLQWPALLDGTDGQPLGAHSMPIELVEGWAAAGTRLYRACSPGIARVSTDDWASLVRVSRRAYVGRGIFRHTAEADNQREA